MPLRAKAERHDRHVVRAILVALIAVALAGCAKEPPPEAHRQSLKDSWTNGTTVTQTAAQPVKTVYVRQPVVPSRAARVVKPHSSTNISPPSASRAARVVKPPVVATPAPALAPPPASRPAPPLAPSPPPPAVPRIATPKAPLPKQSPPDLALSSPSAEPPRPLSESDLAGDTMRCGVGVDCLAILRAMVADPQQSWMARTPTMADFTNGTRLFAYRALRPTLDCSKLRFANAELDWAVDTFRGVIEGVDVKHRARVAALAEAVRAELQDEIKKRC